MLSADPVVPDPFNAQAWNRYSYVGNDPLKFTDPSGHSWLSEFFHAVGNFFKSILESPIVRAIVQIAIAALLPAAMGPYAAAIAAAAVTGLAGGKLGDILKAAVIAGVTAFAFDAVGAATKAIAKDTPTDARMFNVASHAGVGCLSAVASGGHCGPGALADGIVPVPPARMMGTIKVGIRCFAVDFGGGARGVMVCRGFVSRVIPGRAEGANPESRATCRAASGFRVHALRARPGMTTPGLRQFARLATLSHDPADFSDD